MFLVQTETGELVTACEHAENATRLMRTIPRAWRVCTAEGVLIAWKTRDNLLALVSYGEQAGAPRDLGGAWVQGGWN